MNKTTFYKKEMCKLVASMYGHKIDNIDEYSVLLTEEVKDRVLEFDITGALVLTIKAVYVIIGSGEDESSADKISAKITNELIDHFAATPDRSAEEVINAAAMFASGVASYDGDINGYIGELKDTIFDIYEMDIKIGAACYAVYKVISRLKCDGDLLIGLFQKVSELYHEHIDIAEGAGAKKESIKDVESLVMADSRNADLVGKLFAIVMYGFVKYINQNEDENKDVAIKCVSEMFEMVNSCARNESEIPQDLMESIGKIINDAWKKKIN